MKVLILHGSAHKNGATSILAERFAQGAKDAGHETELVELSEKNIHDCMGCGACQMNGGTCVRKDDMTAPYEQFEAADMIVFASPVYYYTWTSLMKRTLDRTFALSAKLSHKRFYLLSSGAATDNSYMQIMFDCYHQYLGCFYGEDNKDAGILMALGMNTPADMGNTDYAEQAYNMGKSIAM